MLLGEINEINNKIIIKATYKGNEEVKYCFRLRCNGHIVVNCTSWSDNNTFESEITETGYYYAEVWCTGKNESKIITSPVFCIPDDVKNSYKKFLNNNINENIPNLKLYQPVYPFGNIAVLQFKGECPIEINHFCKVNCLKSEFFYHKNKITAVLSSNKMIKDASGTKCCFFGISRTDKNLIIGQNDFLKHNCNESDFHDQIGEYCMIIERDNEIKIFSDYFGFNRMFYYSNDDLFITSNSYHLLLLLLSEANVELSLNTEKIKASFVDSSTLFESNFSWDMDITGVYELPIDKRIVLNSDGYSFEYTSLYNDIRNPQEFDEKKYESLLFKGINEVTDNLRITLEHSDFDNVRIDLTGGMDSRILYCAATRLPRSLTKKLRIRTEFIEPNQSNNEEFTDFQIACSINNIYNYLWDDTPVIYSSEYCEITNGLEQNPQSIYLGNYFTGWSLRLPQHIKSTIHISGGAGEICARPFMKYWFPNARNSEDIVNEYHERINDTTIYPNGYNVLKDRLKKVIDYLPGKIILEKWDNHNLYFRNGYHFSLKYYSDVNCIGWTALQSKSCFLAKLMSWTTDIDMKPQFDIISVINPLISQIPYSSTKQNKEKLEIKEKLYAQGYPNADIKLNFEYDKFIHATKSKQDKSFFLPNADEWNKLKKLQESYFNSNEDVMLYCLRNIVSYSKDLEEMGLYLYAWITHTSHRGNYAHQRFVISNKLLSLYHQIILLKKESEITRQTPHVYSGKDNRSIIETNQIQRPN